MTEDQRRMLPSPVFRLPSNRYRTYAVESFCVTKTRFCLRQHGYVTIICVRFPRGARKPHTNKNQVPLCRRQNTPTAYVLLFTAVGQYKFTEHRVGPGKPR